ncbi:cubilin isoform X1 [Microcaecilia unicolor]|uniref:Cubilin n=1 Tax=Microcaecilia unicolor TaxID=1415580 RepID=A0A6P7XQT6_9AMPH|nr:cubilin isoform X1 [Microcaecilia unicolor]
MEGSRLHRSCIPWVLGILLILSGLNCELEEHEPRRTKRNIYEEQPRMSSESGNLVFYPGSAKNIEFKTGLSGRITINGDDLTEVLNQVRKNKEDITELKRNGAGISQNVSNQLNQLNSKVMALESRFQNLEQTVQRKACDSNPCQNSGTCINLLDAVLCLCTSNWKGTFCSDDVDECQLYAGMPLGCQNGATCVNTRGSYSCICDAEWYGPHCTSKHDDCQGGSQNLCEHGICIDSHRKEPGKSNYSCVCDAGWMSPPGSAACTVDIDECNSPDRRCSQNPPVQCFNTPGSYYCGPCPIGWQGNGYSCQDINECEINNGGCSVAPLVQCMNTMGSYHCGPCPPGYQGDGRRCTQVDVCSVNNGGCHPLASCGPSSGSPTPVCICPPGYSGNGYGSVGCAPVSEICQRQNPCVNGQCIATMSGYICLCDPGWTSTNCTENINECSSNPCQNGGSCVDGINGYFCNCTNTWTGPQCQTPQQVCGGYLRGSSGTFSYPNNPGSEQYDHQVSCAWVVQTDPGKILRISFPFFHLEESSRCRFDFLQIHDGGSASEFMIGKYCGTSVPTELFSTHNSLYFWFRSDHSISRGGFTVAWQSREPECGSELTATYGSINSPGYPGNYPVSRDCYWTISTTPGLLITFAFGTLSIEHHDSCNYDYLEIRDGLLPQDAVLGKFCSSGSPSPVQTTGPYAWIHFHSDSTVTDRGFHITYTTSPSDSGCGGNYTDSMGVVVSPNWPNLHTSNKQCVYIITQPTGEKIYLNFTHLELENHSGCSWNYIEVRDGGTEIDPLIERYCGSTVPAPITSSSNRLWLRFRSAASATGARFRAVYQVACGGQQSGEGVIHSPYYPSSYPHEKTCEWIITQPEGNVARLSFITFNIQNNTDCSSNYAEVRDGSSADSHLIGKYCGLTVPPPVQSTQRSLYVRFQTDSSVTNYGFLARFSSAVQGCGETLTAPQGSITTPGHPTHYPHGINCTWFITVQPGYLIRLMFTTFNMEHSSNCIFDYLEVYDNDTTDPGSKLGRYCGRSIPPSITSSDNTMTLLLVTDASIASEGFSANYISIDASRACNEDFTDASGVFTSPNHPNNYPNNRECIYTITVGTNKQIRLNFTQFILEGKFSAVCTADYVEIRDGGYHTSPFLGRYCGMSTPPVVISHSNRLWIKFKTDSSITRTGFLAHWDGTLTGCGGTLTTASGSFTSPNYPMPYYHNSECYWLLKTSAGSVLEIQFVEFHLEDHRNCEQDYLAIYDGNSTNAQLLAKLCGNEVPRLIQSTASALFVKLRTDRSVSYGGFLATYSHRCQGIVIANRSQGILESSNYPSPYPINQHCNWTIQVTSGNTLSYSFTTFDLEELSNCAYDYVKLYDGPNTQSNLIGTFCGNDRPPSGNTTGTSLHVVFHSESSHSGDGFQMLWHINGCGGDLRGARGSFNSPGYPNKYPDNRECVWYIQTAPGSSIQLIIHEFSIEFHSTCDYDVLEIYGGPDLTSPRLAQLCAPRSAGNPLQVSSTGNTITVRFKTDAFISGKGFNATWDELPGGCGGVFQASSGEIHSPNYPRAYNNNTDCSWIIRVDLGHRVLLNFSDFDIEPHRRCNYDSVTVFDGENGEAPLLARLCGGNNPSAVVSSQNTMYVRLSSDSSIQHRGFSAHFTEACGSLIMTDSIGAALSSPLYPAIYLHNLNCSWIIRAQEPFNHVTLSFTNFIIENRNQNCSTDFVEILDGDNLDAPIRGRYCGSTFPHPITSFGNALVVNFVSDDVRAAEGFRATYAASSSACGGTFHMERGAFSSPSYPDAYPPNTECIWNILSSPGNRLQLSFIMFQLQSSENCVSDYVEIREGNATGQLVGKFCGSSLPDNFTSVTAHILWVKFVSDGSVTDLGFRATFSHLFGNNIVGASGQIASPLWPRNYPHRSNYLWVINVNASQVIRVRVLEMDIEDHYSCSFDRLRFYEGPSIHSHLIGTYCGILPPASFSTFSSSMTIQFLTDSSVSRPGFLLDWYAMDASTGPLPTIAPGACGGVLMTGETPSFLFSPNWPHAYSNRVECTWLIRAPESTVEFNILALDIESHSSCSNDKLIIRDGDNNLAPELMTLCGRELPGPIRSTGDSMFIQFTTDGRVAGGGFNSSYHKGCGGYLHANRGLVSSPSYPQRYHANLNCTWHAVVTSGFVIAVHFQPIFQVQNYGASCDSGDYIELKNGADHSSPPLGPSGGSGRFCGNNPPSSMHTTDNQLFVRFISDSNNEGQGFQLMYEAKSLACGGNIFVSDSNPTGYITSPNHPNNYPPSVDCIWIISVPNGEAVQLSFTDRFDIETSSNCNSSYLELRDGADSSARMIAKLCGNDLPGIQKSSGTILYLRFRTDSSTTHIGFNVTYSIATCGGTIVGQSGTLRSPGYPTHNYPDNSLCEWYLHGLAGHYLIISFEALNLQDTPDCLSDYVEIREYNASGRLLGKYCSSSIPRAVETSNSFAYVKFVSDGAVNALGFRLQFQASIEECGGDLNAVTGTFNSPNYPNLYPHNRVCEWRITVQDGRRVTLTINDLRIQEHQSCVNDYVAIYNGFRLRSPSLQKLCGNVDPGIEVKSSGNMMKVIFVSDGSVSNGGFSATYTSSEDAVCGGTLMDSAGGNFTSPGYNGISNYTSKLSCEWVIQNSNADNSSIYISFQDLHLQYHQNCQYDHLEFRLGNADGELIARVCGTARPSVPLAIFASQVWVHFATNSLVEDTGFHASYQFTNCGGIQRGEMGIISSPNYPQPYESMSHCSWLLEAPEGHTITLTFTYFDIEYHVRCRRDSVTVLNGGSPSSPIIGQYCGTTSPGTIKSGSNKLVVIFNSDHSVQGGGFFATWTTDSLGCGGLIHSDSGTIKSPNWPENFPANSRCTWTIRVHESKHLVITFNNNFQIPDSSGQCQGSYVKVWRGSAERDEDLLAAGCGGTAPEPVLAPSSVITAVFQSQDSPGRGFSASFISRCGVNFTASFGRIISPNYPDEYNNNLSCSYIIDAGSEAFVILQFQSFELESSTNCFNDGVKIFSGSRAAGSFITRSCGTTIPRPVSTKGPMLLYFYSNSATVGHGFQANYRVLPCGGTFSSSYGTVNSPTHSFTNYHNNMNCTYLITARSNRVVELKFNQFDLEASSSCVFDYVAVYDGPNINATSLGKFCGNVLPPILRSSNTSLLLVFRTDFSITRGGWRASYRQTLGPQHGCGGFLTNSRGSFGSPDSDFDGKYDKYLDCVWTMAAPVNKKLNLTFLTFALEAQSSGNCVYDYVKVYDGSDTNAVLVGTFCGSILPESFLSTSNFLTVRFVSDSFLEREGFNATYTTVDIQCGGTYNATSTPQTTASPYFPNAYPPFTNCIWTIDAPPQENIKIEVQTFHLQPNPDCSQNYLEFKDFPVGDQGQVHRFCGNEDLTIPDFFSYGRTAVVTFKSEAYLNANGLSFTYQVAGCSREYNQSFGYLKSPGWPGEYPHSVECIIILRAPENHTISLFFNAFNLEAHLNCYDFLEVRNGSDANSPSLGKYCGAALPNPIFPKNRALYLRFKSDSSISHRGYEITWTSFHTGCGGVLYGDHGSFTSPEYPGTYSNNTDCEWNIIAPVGRIVTISFAFISIDDPGDCSNNYLKLYNVPNVNIPAAGPYCGAATDIAPFISSSHRVFIKFHAEYVNLPSSFRLTWSS